MKSRIVVASAAASLLVLTAAFAALGATSAPHRIAEGHTVVSPQDPKAKITLPSRAIYVGTDRWLMKRYANQVELFAFVEATKTKKVQRLYWVQFEAYLPSRPELKHTYGSTRQLTLDGMDFLVDTWVTTHGTDAEESDSDNAHLKRLLGASGYSLPGSMMSVRLVHLMDGKRKELMYIYSEDTALTGYSATALKPGGSAYRHWPQVEADLIRRARQSIGFNQSG